MTPFDIAVVATYVLVILAVGFIKGRGEGHTRDFVVASRRAPWPAVWCSIVATEMSAATFIGMPAVGYGENLNYVQFVIGSLLGRVAIAALFLGPFYRADVLTVYEYLARRFGDSTRYTASLFFFVTRIMASGVRLMIAATGLSVVLGWPIEWTIVVFALLAMAYTAFGGIKAIIWTDVVQLVTFLGAGLAAAWYLLASLPDGWATVQAVAGPAGRLAVFRWMPTEGGLAGWFNEPTLFWLALLYGGLGTFAALGVDQDLTQRMLACRDARRAQWSVVLSGLGAIPATVLFLGIGTLLFCYFEVHPDPALPDADRVFPYFMTTVLPSGLKGILVAGLIAAAMSSLDSALGALSSSAVVDIYRPLLAPGRGEHHYLRVSRFLVFLFGLALIGFALVVKDATGLLWLCFKISGITYGSLLAVFLVGVLTRRGSNWSNLVGMVSSSVVVALLLALIETGRLSLAWTWLFPLGVLWAAVVCLLGRPEKASGEAESQSTRRL